MTKGIAGAARERLIHVIQGDYAVARDDSRVMTAVLGSCVAACLRDPVPASGA